MDDTTNRPFAFGPDDDNRGAAAIPGKGGLDTELGRQVLAALQTVYDPEIPVNLVDLGLIYDLTVGEDGKVAIEMTLTTPSCPVAEGLPGQVADAVRTVSGVTDVNVELVWTPPWDPSLMTEEARLELGML